MSRKANLFFNFRKKFSKMSEAEFAEIYRKVDVIYDNSPLIKRNTNLTSGCFDEILRSIRGESVLEVGCGKAAFLSKHMSEGHHVTAVDINIEPGLKKEFPNITFKESNIEQLPFENKAFDTVVSTHTLEHVIDIFAAIQELRRVTRKRLIIVVPKQRPYRYTFDLHLHFFPYEHSLMVLMGNRNNTCRTINGDLFYIEDISH